MIKVKNNGKHIFRVNKYNILPGVNYIEDHSVIENRVFDAYVDHGKIEILEKDLNPGNNQEKSIYSMTAKEAIREINDIYDPRLLKEISANDTRKTVSDAAANKLESILQ